MAKREVVPWTRRKPVEVDKDGYSTPRWGNNNTMDEKRCAELYADFPVPPRAGECESPKRLVGRNKYSGR